MLNARHLSQEEFADKSGKMVNTISKIERGIGDPKITTLRDIATGLDVDLFDLLDVDACNHLHCKKSNEKIINRIQEIRNRDYARNQGCITNSVHQKYSP